MEELRLKLHKIDENNELLEINRKKINEVEYVLLLQNQVPNNFFVGEVKENNTIELCTNKMQSIKLLSELLKDKKTDDVLQSIADRLK